MNKILINARYVIAPVLIIAAMIGVLVGGMYSWLGLLLLGVGIVIDTMMRNQTEGAGYDEDGETNGIPGFQNTVMYAMLGVFVLLQLVLAWRIYQYTSGVPLSAGFDHTLFGFLPYQNGITGLDLTGATISSGIFAGIGIIYGHELSHTKGYTFVISRWMMALSGKAHFCYAHVYNHHLELAHEDDPATSPRGRSLFQHYPLAGIGQSRFLYRMEQQRLSRLGKPFLTWENRWLRGYAMSLPTLLLFWFAGGWVGIGCLAIVWLISNFELEALNYMEHYGLIREKGQPIDYRHSWDNSTAFTSWFFIEIGRQADHHDRGETHFWELDEVGAPNVGWGYFTLFALALVPPLYNAYYKEALARWDDEFASDGEREIAKRINQQVGFA